jgi:hypothetical protein
MLVIPAKAGIQPFGFARFARHIRLGPGLRRGDDEGR